MATAATLQLSSELLPSIKAQGKVTMPSYDPSHLEPGILHVGVGNFHRSHLAAYMNDLHNSEEATSSSASSWGIVGAGVLSFDDVKRRVLEPQNWLQTLVQRDATSVQATILGSMVGFVPVDFENPQEHTALQQMLRTPGIKIVSLTVTEGGYFLNGSGALDVPHDSIQHDASFPRSPVTIFGVIAKALKERKDSGMKPFTVMSCDNIPHNGDVVRCVVAGMAKLMYGDDFANWVDQEVCFPNSMVDRITPGTTDEMRSYVEENYGYKDESPIFCEPFRQWVLQDKFSQGRPEWHKLDTVSFVDDVAPYELMKIRILNGGHASLCYPAALLDLEYVHNAMEHPVLGPFLDALERHEIIPTVPPVPKTVLTEYWDSITTRFSNPTICDTIDRICFDGSSRQPKFIVPVVQDALEMEPGKLEGLALVSAFWCRYCQGKTDSGKTIAANDPQWDRLHATALEAAAGAPGKWLAMTDVYGQVVGQNKQFAAVFAQALDTVQTKGAEAAMKEYCDKAAA